jgi:hypothetical protein
LVSEVTEEAEFTNEGTKSTETDEGKLLVGIYKR